MSKKLSELISYLHTSLSSTYEKQEVQGLSRYLMQEVLNLNYSDCILHPEREISTNQWEKLKKIIERLSQQEPIQYILGKAEFYNITINLSHKVLIPRPETEEMVDLIIKRLSKLSEMQILDIGTGSGCIALALKKNFEKAKVEAIDISEQALQQTKINATTNQLDLNIHKEDIFYPLHRNFQYDLIISNPPYVRLSEKKAMLPNVLNYEPKKALFVPDNDALRYYIAIEQFAQLYLKKRGLLFLEINEALATETQKLFPYKEYQTTIHRDLQDKKRFLEVIKN